MFKTVPTILSLALAVSLISMKPVSANQQAVLSAEDQLVTAQAQLDTLITQKKALNELIHAVKEELRAAKLRSKAEKIQVSSDIHLKDAAFLAEQSGIEVELPSLSPPNAPNKIEAASKAADDLFPEGEFDKVDSVFFPGGAQAKPSSSLPDYVR
jgi:hypothetical protein